MPQPTPEEYIEFVDQFIQDENKNMELCEERGDLLLAETYRICSNELQSLRRAMIRMQRSNS